MCLAIPGKVLEEFEQRGLRMAKVQFGGIVREAALDYVPDAKVGDYVLVHVGFAISKWIPLKLNAPTDSSKKWISLRN